MTSMFGSEANDEFYYDGDLVKTKLIIMVAF